MTPAEKAANVHAAISVFRHQRDEVQKYAKSLGDQHVLELPPPPSSENEGPQSPIEFTSPGELNDRLLKALFGKWPPA
jgi:hypothetical protein